MAITGQPSLEAAMEAMQQAMTGANLRACAVTRGSRGATAFTPHERWDVPALPIAMADPTSADAAFAGAIAYAVALHWNWPTALRFANAVAALAARAIGDQTALPTLAEVAALLDRAPSSPP
jgi:sugar/nucleoside kinase (ribokinase family)